MRCESIEKLFPFCRLAVFLHVTNHGSLMTLEALQHLLRSATALAEDCEILILGSASLLASFPELGHPDAPLASTYDADICPQPYDEITAVMLDEALGENRAYFQRHGYHADVLRDAIEKDERGIARASQHFRSVFGEHR